MSEYIPKHLKEPVYIDSRPIMSLLRKLESNIIVIPAVAGTYSSGYMAAYHDIAKDLRKELEGERVKIM